MYFLVGKAGGDALNHIGFFSLAIYFCEKNHKEFIHGEFISLLDICRVLNYMLEMDQSTLGIQQ